MIIRALAGMLLACGVAGAAAAEEPPLTWRGCAMDFARNALDLGNLRLDVPPEKLGRNAPLMAKIIAKDGLANAGLQVHVAYAKCTEPLAIKGLPLEPGEKLASECAAGSVVRLGALNRMRKGEVSLDELKEGSPPEGRDAVEFLYQTAKNYSFTKAVWASLESGLSCIEQARLATAGQ